MQKLFKCGNIQSTIFTPDKELHICEVSNSMPS